MAHFKDKLLIFIMGIMLGLLIAGGFFIFKLDDYFAELSFYKQLSQKLELRTEAKSEDNANKKRETNNYANTNTYKPLMVKSSTDSTLKDTRIIISSIDSIAIKDTVKPDLNQEDEISENSIVVKKDELLATRQVYMENLSISTSANKDSVLSKVSGIRDDKNLLKQRMNIEFWHSPINYKGYKMAKNKVVLFGIAEQEDIKLYHLDDSNYMKLQQGVFKLEYTNDFKQLERINDETVLARLR